MKLQTFSIKMKAENRRGEVRIDGTVGDSSSEDSIAAKGVRDQLDALGEIEEIDLRINSQGGSVFQAFAIYNALKEHPAKVTVHIEGVAASAASLIAMAGDEIRIAENAMLMIHNPVGVAYGEAKDIHKAAEMLDLIRASVVRVYTARTGRLAEDVGLMMDEETWMTSTEAVENGFADVVTKNKLAKPTTKPKAQAGQPGLRLVAMFSGPGFYDSHIELIQQVNANCGGCGCTVRGESLASLEAKYRAEFEDEKHIHNTLGVSVEDYIEQRLIEDGHQEEPILNSFQESNQKAMKNNLPGLFDPTDPAWN